MFKIVLDLIKNGYDNPEIKKAIITLLFATIIGSLITSLYQYMNSRDLARNTSFQTTYWTMRGTSIEVIDMVTKRKYATFFVHERMKEMDKTKDVSKMEKYWEEYQGVIKEYNNKYDGVLSKIYFDIDQPYELVDDRISYNTFYSVNCEDIMKSIQEKNIQKQLVKNHIQIATFCFRDIHRKLAEYKLCIEKQQSCDKQSNHIDQIIKETQGYSNRVYCFMNNRMNTTKTFISNNHYWLLNLLITPDKLDTNDAQRDFEKC